MEKLRSSTPAQTKLIHTIDDLKAPHAIFYRKDSKKLFIVDGDASAVKVYDGDNYQKIDEIKVSIDADSIAYDPATNYLYVVTRRERGAHTVFVDQRNRHEQLRRRCATSRLIPTTWKR